VEESSVGGSVNNTKQWGLVYNTQFTSFTWHTTWLICPSRVWCWVESFLESYVSTMGNFGFVSMGHIPHCSGMRAGRMCPLVGLVGAECWWLTSFLRRFCVLLSTMARQSSTSPDFGSVSIKVAILTNKCSFTPNMSLMWAHCHF
jgi:hypothetical protein